jgi:hypothetical protein
MRLSIRRSSGVQEFKEFEEFEEFEERSQESESRMQGTRRDGSHHFCRRK